MEDSTNGSGVSNPEPQGSGVSNPEPQGSCVSNPELTLRTISWCSLIWRLLCVLLTLIFCRVLICLMNFVIFLLKLTAISSDEYLQRNDNKSAAALAGQSLRVEGQTGELVNPSVTKQSDSPDDNAEKERSPEEPVLQDKETTSKRRISKRRISLTSSDSPSKSLSAEGFPKIEMSEMPITDKGTSANLLPHHLSVSPEKPLLVRPQSSSYGPTLGLQITETAEMSETGPSRVSHQSSQLVSQLKMSGKSIPIHMLTKLPVSEKESVDRSASGEETTSSYTVNIRRRSLKKSLRRSPPEELNEKSSLQKELVPVKTLPDQSGPETAVSEESASIKEEKIRVKPSLDRDVTLAQESVSLNKEQSHDHGIHDSVVSDVRVLSFVECGPDVAASQESIIAEQLLHKCVREKSKPEEISVESEIPSKRLGLKEEMSVEGEQASERLISEEVSAQGEQVSERLISEEVSAQGKQVLERPKPEEETSVQGKHASKSPKPSEETSVQGEQASESPKPSEETSVQGEQASERPKPPEETSVQGEQASERPKSAEETSIQGEQASERPKPEEETCTQDQQATERPKSVKEVSVEDEQTSERPKLQGKMSVQDEQASEETSVQGEQASDKPKPSEETSVQVEHASESR